jgi:hypothetical protein
LRATGPAELGQDDEQDAEVDQHQDEGSRHRLFLLAARHRRGRGPDAELAVAERTTLDVEVLVAERHAGREVEVVGRVVVTVATRAVGLAVTSGLVASRLAVRVRRARVMRGRRGRDGVDLLGGLAVWHDGRLSRRPDARAW